MMRSSLWTAIAAASLWLMVAAAGSDAQPIEQVMEDGRLLVGLREVSEWLGAQVDWSELTRGVAVSMPQRLVVVQVDLPRAWVNGREQSLQVPPRIIGGRVHVPLRFIAEALGARVEYHGSYLDLVRSDGQTRRVYLQASVRTEARFD